MAYYDKELLDLNLLGATMGTLSGQGTGAGIQAVQKMKQMEAAQMNQQLANQKLALETAKLANEINTGNRDASITYSLESQQQDALVPEAFGLLDAVQMGLAGAGSFIGMKNFESNKALGARNKLNQDILAIGASLYSGRPSKFLLERIEATLPKNALEGDDRAYSKYSKLKQIFSDQLTQFEGLLNTATTASDRVKYKQKLGDLDYMVKRLDVVLGAFEGAGYGRQEFYDSPDMFAGEITTEESEELKKFFMGDM